MENEFIPIILAIESTGATCSVAVGKGSAVLAEYSVFIPNFHDKLLAEFIKRIIQDCSISIEEVAAVAVSAGPGSFTGVRIGASVAKALCFENKPKLIAVPTLSAIAYNAVEYAHTLGKHEIIATVHSHKDLLYFQRFNLQCEELTKVRFLRINEFSSIEKNQAIVCGTAPIAESGFGYFNQLNAGMIAKFAYPLYLNEQFTEPSEFVPMYFQDFQPKK